MKKYFRCAALFLFLIQVNLSIIYAQGTAFTYQGRLNSGSVAANGSYDMVFTLYGTNVAGSIIAGPVTNSAVAVTNGLFTTTVDFGAGVFAGTSDWLEIAVRTNGATDFATLSPRQLLTPTPYASYAANASSAQVAGSADSVSGANITGTIPLAHISAAVLTNNGSGVNLSGSFSGDGAGLTNLNVPGVLAWQIVPGTAVQTEPNTGYVVTNDLPVTLTLPAAPAIGDVVRVTGAGTGGWQIARNSGQLILTTNLPATTNVLVGWKLGVSDTANPVASSADGVHLIAAGSYGTYYTSSNSGMTWVAGNFTNQSGFSISPHAWAMSSDGSKVVAMAQASSSGKTQIYTSTDFGVTWTLRTNGLPPDYSAPAGQIASSADGVKLVAVVRSSIYTSVDSGLTWTQQTNAPQGDTYSLASSGDGTKLLVGIVGGNGGLYLSMDSGVTWTAPAGMQNWSWGNAVVSADGTKMAAIGGLGLITSTDSGATWTVKSIAPVLQSTSFLFSPDGTKLLLVRNGQIYSSTDMGVSFQAMPNSPTVYALACSADGSKLVAAGFYLYGTGIYAYRSQWTLHGGMGDSIELQYIGNGLFQPISYVGTIFPSY